MYKLFLNPKLFLKKIKQIIRGMELHAKNWFDLISWLIVIGFLNYIYLEYDLKIAKYSAMTSSLFLILIFQARIIEILINTNLFNGIIKKIEMGKIKSKRFLLLMLLTLAVTISLGSLIGLIFGVFMSMSSIFMINNKN